MQTLTPARPHTIARAVSAAGKRPPSTRRQSRLPPPRAEGGNPLADNPLFAANPAFAAALRGALDREGEDVLSSGEAMEDDRPDALSETLLDGLRQSRRAVVELEAVSQVVGALLARERRQFERLQFVLKKVGNDAAFAKSIAKVRAAEKEELGRYKEKYGELVE